MEQLRPVDYIKRTRTKTGSGVLSHRWTKEAGKGSFHGIVRGTTELGGMGQYGAYDYALVEDGKTGQLIKVELTDIVFTDVSLDEPLHAPSEAS